MYPSKFIVVLISGKAGVGKTTLAGILKEICKVKKINAEIASFASGVKYTATMMGWNGEKDTAGRRLLQNIGKTGREYEKDIWVKLLYEQKLRKLLEDTTIVFIDDWRFPNEFDFLSKKADLEVFKVRIEAPSREILRGTSAYNDESETSLPDAYSFAETSYYDIAVKNEGSINAFNITAEYVLKYILDNCKKWE